MVSNAESTAKSTDIDVDDVVGIIARTSSPSVLILCEHASRHIPDELNRLGLSEEAANSHAAWDPGALGVAERLAEILPAVLVFGKVSRLVYDCNRPPEAESAIPEQSEIYDVPGNKDLSSDAKDERRKSVYAPFKAAVEEQIDAHRATLDLMITVHSFTPVFHGKKREVELGILHGRDDMFARQMMECSPSDGPYETRLNEPYAASDGVAHSLDLYGAENDLPNAMIEVRNDLIENPEAQRKMAEYLASWISAARETLGQRGEKA